MRILNFDKFSLCYSTKTKLASVGYTVEPGLLGVANAGVSGLTSVGYTDKFGLRGVAYTGEYKSLVWPTQGTPPTNFSQKKLHGVGYFGESGLTSVGYTGEFGLTSVGYRRVQTPRCSLHR
jgi:hypothetical protein